MLIAVAALCYAGTGNALAAGHDNASAYTANGAAPDVSISSVLDSPAGNLTAGPRSNGTGVLPDGRYVTPVGRSIQVQLEPQNGVLSADGKRLYVSSEGVDDNPPTDSNDHDNTAHARFISVVNTGTLAVTKIEDDALHSGLAEAADGLTLYVAEGATDSLGVFHRVPAADGGVGSFTKIGDYPLKAPTSGTAAATYPNDYPDQLALSPDGSKVYLTGFSENTLMTVQVTGPGAGTVFPTVSTGAYPYAVTLSPDGTRAYVSNWGEYNTAASTTFNSPISTPPATYGGYNTVNSDSVWSYDLTTSPPTLLTATKIGENLDGGDVDGGSSPSAMSLSPDGRTLAVTSSNDDEVELLDTTTTTTNTAVPSMQAPTAAALPETEIDLRAVVGTAAFAAPTGAQPDAVTWSRDGKVLFAGEGERNDVVVIDPSLVAPEGTAATIATAAGDGPGSAAGPNRDAVVGRIPTAWYPSSLVVSPDSDHLYVTSMRGLGSGPNTAPGDTDPAANESEPANDYIPNTIKGEVTDLELSAACSTLPSYTADSDRDNGLVPQGTEPTGDPGNGYVVPTSFGQPASAKIKHVFLIIKENRPFDQVFGDFPGVEADGHYTAYGNYDTPNIHSLAAQFGISDNYYATAETSTQGHYSVDTGQVNEFTDKVIPSDYANKYPFEPFDTTPENEPEGGFIWNNAARHGVRSTIFGEATVVVGLGPTALGQSPATTSAGQIIPGAQQNALTVFDPLYPTQVNIQGNFSNPSGVNPAETLYPYNDEGRASAFRADLLSSLGVTLPGVAGTTASAATIGQLNVMVLFDDHTSGDIAGAQTPERQVAENDHALGEVVNTISTSSYWPNSAIFVTEDDTQGGQDHVDGHRSYGVVISPYAKRNYVSHVHTSFSSMNKTIDLLLGLPPTSLQELTATSMSDMFISSGRPNDTPTTVLANNTQPDTNQPVALAKNATLRKAAQLATRIAPGIDQGGSLLPLDTKLEREGELEAHDPNVKPATTTVTHTLPVGSPDAVTEGPPVATHGVPASDTCLAAFSSVTPALGETRRPILLVGAAAILGLFLLLLRRRRRVS